MKIQDPVKQETKKIAIGVGVLSVVMILIYAALGRLNSAVVYGTLLGSGYAVFNFFLMAMTVQHAAEQMNGVRLPVEEENAAEEASAEQKEELPQQKAARGIVQKSYYLRLVLTATVIVLAIKAPVFDAVPTVIAQFFPRIVITLQPMLQKIRKGE